MRIKIRAAIEFFLGLGKTPVDPSIILPFVSKDLILVLSSPEFKIFYQIYQITL